MKWGVIQQNQGQESEITIDEQVGARPTKLAPQFLIRRIALQSEARHRSEGELWRALSPSPVIILELIYLIYNDLQVQRLDSL